MKLEDQVCSLEQAKKLKKLCVNLNARNVWITGRWDNYLHLKTGYGWNLLSKKEKESAISAPTIAEMMYLLKNYTNWKFVDLRDNQADYLADILINEIKDGQIDPKELKL